MTIRFVKTLLNTLAVLLVVFSLVGMVEAQHYPVWPIAQNEDPDHWDRVNCTFGERHSEHFLRFHVEDAADRIDRDESGRDVNAKVKVIVDNFRPFVKKVDIRSGEFRLYSSLWMWDTETHMLNLTSLPGRIKGKADRQQNLMITVETSEPGKEVMITS